MKRLILALSIIAAPAVAEAQRDCSDAKSLADFALAKTQENTNALQVFSDRMKSGEFGSPSPALLSALSDMLRGSHERLTMVTGRNVAANGKCVLGDQTAKALSAML